MTKSKIENYCKETPGDFYKIHSDNEQQLKAWYQETSQAKREGSNQIKLEYPNASFLAYNRVVSNIKGNHID